MDNRLSTLAPHSAYWACVFLNFSTQMLSEYAGMSASVVRLVSLWWSKHYYHSNHKNPYFSSPVSIQAAMSSVFVDKLVADLYVLYIILVLDIYYYIY